jgi:hypothetical protein
VRLDISKQLFNGRGIGAVPANQTPPAHPAVYTDFGQHAVASGQRPVYVGSKPHQAWVKFRGEDGMPGFIDCIIVDVKSHQVLWLPSVYPPRRVDDKND